MYSYICTRFWCQQCYEESFEKADTYALNELHLPVERMYGSLMKYIDGGMLPKLESYHMDYKEVFDKFMADRLPYITPQEEGQLRKAIVDVKLMLQEIWSKVEDLQKEYAALKTDQDWETMLLNNHRWSAICWDFKHKYLSRDWVQKELARRTDHAVEMVTTKSDFCSMCLEKQGNLRCNNLEDKECYVCKPCARYCS